MPSKPKKTTSNKEKAKKISPKKTVPKSKSSRKSTAKKTTRSRKSNSEVVVLPNIVSEEAVKKATELESELQNYIHKSAYSIAYVSALCFIFVGATLSISTLFSSNLNLKAEVISVIAGSTSQSVSLSDRTENHLQDITTDTVKILPAEFKLLSSVPDNVVEPTQIKFSVTNSSEIEARLISLEHKATRELSVLNVTAKDFYFTIPSDIENGYYEIRISFVPNDGSGRKVHSTKRFFVGAVEQEKVVTDVSINENESNSTNSTSTSSSETTTSSDSAVNDNINTEIKEPVSIIEKPEKSEPLFSLDTPVVDVVSGTFSLTGSITDKNLKVELFARALNSLNSRFVTTGTQRHGKYYFVVNSIDFPNGDYEFVIQADSNGKVIKSNGVVLKIKNLLKTEQVTSENGSPNETPIENRPFLETREIVFEPVETLDEETTEKVTEIIDNEDTNINDLLKKYATAFQSGDQILIESAERRLQKAKENIITQTLSDEKTKNNSDNINQELEVRIDDLKRRITVFENVRKEKSGGLTALDTDKDGISDFDEVNLYKTDPNNADSDGDGISDGVELVQGYDPLNSESEAIIRYESPKETVALERVDALKIEEVSPIIANDLDSTTVRTEIRGVALPNSIVTLYIFSTPIVVTVKTDADGSFVYTFDKELEDGQHDIYVAVTDNAGSILAQSNPFSFIKQAEAFEPVGANTSEITPTETIIKSSSSNYGVVIGMALLAFGLILLMLGISLRSKNEEETLTDTSIKTQPSIVVN